MDQATLKAIQTPLKEDYKSNPENALITLKAKGIPGENVSCKVETGRALAQAGLHPATGGDGTYICSGDMLLEALVACAGVTMGAVSTSLGINITGSEIRAEGDIDFRGTLGVSKEVAVGFQKIRLYFDIHSNADPEQIQTLIKLTERYCVVLQTLRHASEIQSEIKAI